MWRELEKNFGGLKRFSSFEVGWELEEVEGSDELCLVVRGKSSWLSLSLRPKIFSFFLVGLFGTAGGGNCRLAFGVGG